MTIAIFDWVGLGQVRCSQVAFRWGMARPDQVQFGQTWDRAKCLVEFGIRLGQVRLGQVRLSLGGGGYVRLHSLNCVLQIGLGWVRLHFPNEIRLGCVLQTGLGEVVFYKQGKIRLGQVRSDQIRLGQVRLGQIRLDQVRLGVFPNHGEVRLCSPNRIKLGVVRLDQIRLCSPNMVRLG